MCCKGLRQHKLLSKLLFSILLCASTIVLAQRNVQGLRVWASPDSTRLVFDLSDPVKYKLFTLDNPYRVVIDIEDARYSAILDESSLKDSGILKLRHGPREKGVRLVLDMQEKVKPASFMLAPNQAYGHRLVVDLTLKGPSKIISAAQSVPATAKITDHNQLTTREFIVAIDPGHGGEDTGAIGNNLKIREKDVVLAVSKKLESLINAQSGMKAFLVRKGDYYVGLRNRMGLAREQGADLFISLHADSFKDPRASGASVFVLSEKGASNEAARWLAERENRSDLIGGVKLEDKGDLLASVLLDLSQTASESASHELANHLISNLSKVTDLHHKTVQRAGFMVLKSPDIPSVLVELGFISNQNGEKKLKTKMHQDALAQALLSGVQNYVAKRPKPVKQPEELTIAKK
ncbi:MAG: N-acetylmuramoyl-L-alanine amidase [Proteobacteria bacterium]|nr:N-acetylmuramoyl-L-alanine amidase [Pseudomonadota bacterium]